MTHTSTRRSLLGLTVALPLLFGSAVPVAQAAYPDKPITIIVPFTAGGVVDVITRTIGEKLSSKYGQPVIVDNRPGAGGNIGTDTVSKAAPDGYTLLSVSPGHAVSPSLRKDLQWHPVKDFRAVAGFGIVPNVVVVHPDVPARSMKELLEMAKKSDTPVTYGTAGNGTSNHLSGALLASMAKVNLQQVPYRGQPNALTDLMAGRVQMMPLTIALAKQHIESGKLVPLAVTTAQRAKALPDVPTVAEAAGLPGYEVGTWFGFVAPKATPDSVVSQLSTDIAAILAMPDVQEKLAGIGMEVNYQDAKAFDTFVEGEYEKWSKVMKEAGIQPQ
ncbi:MAG: Bug family tripartite tricarboxylate transporter substrate binding protein [Burkholderiaceae bacterium]